MSSAFHVQSHYMTFHNWFTIQFMKLLVLNKLMIERFEGQLEFKVFKDNWLG